MPVPVQHLFEEKLNKDDVQKNDAMVLLTLFDDSRQLRTGFMRGKEYEDENR